MGYKEYFTREEFINMVEAYNKAEKERQELKAENKRLKDKLKQSEQAREQLAKELVRTKISLECTDNTIKKQQENIKELEQENTKLQSMITKIKAIAEQSSPFIDNLEIKSATEVRYDYAAICNELELRLHKVLEVITEAEEE